MLYRVCLFLSLLCSSRLCAEAEARRIQGMLAIGAVEEAVSEAKNWHEREPCVESLYLHTLALARQGHYSEALNFLDTTQAEEREALLEEIAWSVLEQASQSSSLPVRLYSVIGAAESRDARGVLLLQRALLDRNMRVRELAAQLTASYPDAQLNQILIEQLQLPENAVLRRALIQALGRQGGKASRNALMDLLAQDNLPAEVRNSAAQALCEIAETPVLGELAELASSPSAGLRLLACRWAARCGVKGLRDILKQRCIDPLPEVRIAAIEALGLHGGVEFDPECLEKALNDISPKVRITAAWALLLHGYPQGEKFLKSLLSAKEPLLHSMITSALAHSGKSGIHLSCFALDHVQDPAARLNAAMALLSQNVVEEKAVLALEAALCETHERLEWCETGNLFSGVYMQGPGSVGPGEAIARDQLLRLRLFALMASRVPERAWPAIEAQLESRRWQISGLAAYQILTEANLEHVESLGERMEQVSPRLRTQLALVLAIVGRDPLARQVLEEEYSSSDRHLKERILEGLGAVADRKSLPLLTGVLREPYENLRIIAASAVIKCLNR